MHAKNKREIFTTSSPKEKSIRLNSFLSKWSEHQDTSIISLNIPIRSNFSLWNFRIREPPVKGVTRVYIFVLPACISLLVESILTAFPFIVSVYCDEFAFGIHPKAYSGANWRVYSSARSQCVRIVFGVNVEAIVLLAFKNDQRNKMIYKCTNNSISYYKNSIFFKSLSPSKVPFM